MRHCTIAHARSLGPLVKNAGFGMTFTVKATEASRKAALPRGFLPGQKKRRPHADDDRRSEEINSRRD